MALLLLLWRTIMQGVKFEISAFGASVASLSNLVSKAFSLGSLNQGHVDNMLKQNIILSYEDDHDSVDARALMIAGYPVQQQ